MTPLKAAFVGIGLTAVGVCASSYAQNAAAGSQNITVTRSGAQRPQRAPEERFTGVARVQPVFTPGGPSRMSGAYVTFEAGARTAWHTHPAGQTLVVTAGTGRVQHWGGPIQQIRAGEVVRIPAGVKHWHGAAPNAAMTHVAVQEEFEGSTVTWMEKVSDAQYLDQQARPGGNTGMKTEPTTAQRLVGDIAPKLAELTDEVLFADVWERPELAKRDRSLVTVSALIAGGNTEQLRSHLALAKANGVTETELVEAITHLAFYTGWPKAMSAMTVAKEVFRQK